MMTGESIPAIAAEGVTVNFGGLIALNQVDLRVPAGSRYGILGANGAGKTTLFNVISGFIIPTVGRVSIFGQPVTRLPPRRRTGLGLARTFQITNLFEDLTALENVLMSALVTSGNQRDFWRPARRIPEARRMAERILGDLGLAHLADVLVGNVGYGEQRLLEVAVALALAPRILLLDEPTAGLSAAETATVLDLIQGLPQDLTVIIIEHDLDVIFEVSEYLSVLHYGECVAAGPADAVRLDPVVKDVYLGAH